MGQGTSQSEASQFGRFVALAVFGLLILGAYRSYAGSEKRRIVTVSFDDIRGEGRTKPLLRQNRMAPIRNTQVRQQSRVVRPQKQRVVRKIASVAPPVAPVAPVVPVVPVVRVQEPAASVEKSCWFTCGSNAYQEAGSVRTVQECHSRAQSQCLRQKCMGAKSEDFDGHSLSLGFSMKEIQNRFSGSCSSRAFSKNP